MPGALRGQAVPGAEDSSAAQLTYAIPESPAFTFLGVAPTKVTRASSPRDLGAALTTAIDSTGRVVNGVAIGATVWTLLPDVAIPLRTYRSNGFAYALANSHLSLGTARAS